jgi:hypothetical protein
MYFRTNNAVFFLPHIAGMQKEGVSIEAPPLNEKDHLKSIEFGSLGRRSSIQKVHACLKITR